jgi:hypothetical protein
MGTNHLTRLIGPVNLGRWQQRPIRLGDIGIVGRYKFRRNHTDVEQRQQEYAAPRQGIFLESLPPSHGS